MHQQELKRKQKAKPNKGRRNRIRTPRPRIKIPNLSNLRGRNGIPGVRKLLDEALGSRLGGVMDAIGGSSTINHEYCIENPLISLSEIQKQPSHYFLTYKYLKRAGVKNNSALQRFLQKP